MLFSPILCHLFSWKIQYYKGYDNQRYSTNIKYDKEKQHMTFEKLDAENIWCFCLKNGWQDKVLFFLLTFKNLQPVLASQQPN